MAQLELTEFGPLVARDSRLDGQLAEKLERSARTANDFLARATRAFSAIFQNPDVRGETRDRQIKDLAREVRKQALEALPTWRGDAVELEIRLLEGKLVSGPAIERIANIDPETAREIRDRARELDPGSRSILLLDAAHNGDAETIAALQAAPRAFPLVPEDELLRAREAFARSRDPEAMAELDTLRRLHAHMVVNADMALGALLNISRGAISFAPTVEETVAAAVK